jgi:hypothetical protein
MIRFDLASTQPLASEEQKTLEIAFYIDQLKKDLSEGFTTQLEQQFRSLCEKSKNLFATAQSFEIELYIKRLKKDLGDNFTPIIEEQFRKDAQKPQRLFDLVTG